MVRRLALLALLTLILVVPATAATVQVEVVDENGVPVGRPLVYLQRAEDDSSPGNPVRRRRYVEADAAGRARFDGILPGYYALGAKTSGALHVKAENNPLAPSVRLTIDDPDQRVEVRLELHRGTQLCARFVIDGSRLDARGKVGRKELESGYATERRLKREEEFCEPLFAGRWELRLEPPGGYVLVDLDVNGVSTEGHIARLDLQPGSPTQHVTWYLVALARLEGKVHFEGDRFGVAIRAELLQAGAWLTQAETRGGSLYAPVQAYPDSRTGDYAVDLPDGRWRIQPVGDDLEEADPSVVEVDIAQGEQHRQDFTVRGEASGYQPGLRVSVRSPKGDRVAEAVVEVWPVEPQQRGEVPVASARTHRWGTARISGLESGSYRLVAGHPSYRESARTIVFDPDDDDSRSQSIRLSRAASLNVRLVSDEEHDVAGGAIELTRNDDPLPTELADEKLLRELRQPRAQFDATDRASVSGIYAGTYRVKGLHDRLLFEFKQGGRWVEEPEVVFTDGQSRELEARIVPAATVAGSLYCVNGEPMPGNTEVRVVPSSTRPRDPLDPAWQSEVVLARNSLLGGEHRDVFHVGPLPPADYLVAVQPATFDRWTWAYGTENGADAQSFQARPGEQIELGAVSVDCGPALRATVTVGTGRSAPDLSETRWARELQFQAEIVTQDGRSDQLEHTDLDRYERLLILRGFREGKLRGEISLRHDYFVPDPWIRVPVSGELSRGRTIDIVVPVADVGGAIELNVVSRDPVVARLVDANGIQRTTPVEGGNAGISNLAVGVYQLLLCGDSECTTLLHEPETIEIEQLQTLELRRLISGPKGATEFREPDGLAN